VRADRLEPARQSDDQEEAAAPERPDAVVVPAGQQGDDQADSELADVAGLKLRDAFWNSLTSGSGPMADMSHTDLKRLARLLGWGPSQ
jgi:hypothetical protein